MTRKTKHTNSEQPPTFGKPLPPNLQRFWEELQRKYYPEKYGLIDFVPETEADNYWRWGIKIFNYKSPIKASYRKQFDAIKPFEDFVGNDDLKIIFHDGYRHSTLLWTQLENTIQPNGFYIPKGEIARLEKEHIEPYLLYLKLLKEAFPTIQLLKAIKRGKSELGMMETPLPLVGVWQYFQFYAKFLKEVKAKNIKGFKEITKVLAQTISAANFNQKLPSAQIWALLQSEFQVYYFNGMTAVEQETLVKNAHQSVQDYWTIYKDSVRFIVENGYPAISKRSIGNRKMIYSGKDTAKAFYNLFLEELEWVKIQEIIDPQFENKYTALPLDNTRWKFRTDRVQDTATAMKQAIGDKSILDRIKENSTATVELKKPLFTRPSKDWLSTEGQKWYDFTIEERKELLVSAENDLNHFQQDEVASNAQKRWNVYLESFANQIFSPFFYWTSVEDNLVPQWNVLPTKKAHELSKAFEETLSIEIKEKAKLEKYITYLYTKKTLAKTQEFVDQIKPFRFDHLQQQWDKAAKAQLLSIRHKGAYRLRRMEEFGMLKSNKAPDKKLEVWLDELLQIEKEVGPYIPFVQQAFLMALPSKTSVEFDPYRHSHDGIEFDPETTQDQHKWLRGEVMKSLRVRSGKADAEQVNAFALDFSGSMRHKRMRNLFKILYLMVLGLEDRKSYDAFHFFGTDFIETVNFSNDYTNKSLLFRVLKQIARIDYEGVRYGGIGGTNMSQGIIGCHDRIKVFAKKLKEKYPKRFFLKSIFVITDGEPSLGIHIPEALNLVINKKRKDGNIAIKGIYLRPEDEKFASFMERIFGKDQFVETDDFAEAINRLVFIMTQTYKQQRINLRQQKIKEKYERSRNLYQ